MTLQLFAFDMAGTTVRDQGVVLETFKAVADEASLAVETTWLQSRMGWDKQTVFRELLARSGRDTTSAGSLAERFQVVLAARFDADPPRPIAGVEEVLEALEASGVRVAFTTGFARATADLLLQRLGWTRFVSVASDEVDRGRPAPDLIFEVMRRTGVTDPAQVGAAGDTPSDLAAATTAGCQLVVGVGTGSYSLEDLADHPHTHLLPDLRTLPQIVAQSRRR